GHALPFMPRSYLGGLHKCFQGGFRFCRQRACFHNSALQYLAPSPLRRPSVAPPYAERLSFKEDYTACHWQRPDEREGGRNGERTGILQTLGSRCQTP